MKFVGDFDFEKSNAEFDKNAIEDEIKKSLSLKPHKSETSTDSSNSTEHHDKDKENQHTYSSSTQSEHHEQQVCPLDGYYDKQKSFFDRISCESNEKEKTYAASFSPVRQQTSSVLERLVATGTKNVA